MMTNKGTSPSRPSETLTCVPLHDHPQYMDECVELLNSEWLRSRSARLWSLKQGSSDTFPTSLLLLSTENNGNSIKVIGHSKVCAVPRVSDACFVESVVIDRRIRGKGHGKALMDFTEAFVKRKGIKTIYLTSQPASQGFYTKLGYSFCEPIVGFGGGCSPALQKLVQNLNLNSSINDGGPSVPLLQHRKTGTGTSEEVKSELDHSTATPTCPLPPPPPPPLPDPKVTNSSKNKVFILSNLAQPSNIHMKKSLV